MTHPNKDGRQGWVRKIDEQLGPEGSLTRTLHEVLASGEHAVQLVSVNARRSDGPTAS